MPTSGLCGRTSTTCQSICSSQTNIFCPPSKSVDDLNGGRIYMCRNGQCMVHRVCMVHTESVAQTLVRVRRGLTYIVLLGHVKLYRFSEDSLNSIGMNQKKVFEMILFHSIKQLLYNQGCLTLINSLFSFIYCPMGGSESGLPGTLTSLVLNQVTRDGKFYLIL